MMRAAPETILGMSVAQALTPFRAPRMKAGGSFSSRRATVSGDVGRVVSGMASILCISVVTGSVSATAPSVDAERKEALRLRDALTLLNMPDTFFVGVDGEETSVSVMLVCAVLAERWLSDKEVWCVLLLLRLEAESAGEVASS